MNKVTVEIPTGETVEGPAFHGFFKCLSTVIVTGLCALAADAWRQGHLQSSLQSSGWVAAALAMMLYMQWHILTSRSRISADKLEQTWVWSKSVRIEELAYAKLFRIQGLEWLIAPRLYTRSISNKLTVFYASSPVQLSHFQRLSETLAQAQRH